MLGKHSTVSRDEVLGFHFMKETNICQISLYGRHWTSNWLSLSISILLHKTVTPHFKDGKNRFRWVKQIVQIGRAGICLIPVCDAVGKAATWERLKYWIWNWAAGACLERQGRLRRSSDSAHAWEQGPLVSHKLDQVMNQSLPVMPSCAKFGVTASINLPVSFLPQEALPYWARIKTWSPQAISHRLLPRK